MTLRIYNISDSSGIAAAPARCEDAYLAIFIAPSSSPHFELGRRLAWRRYARAQDNSAAEKKSVTQLHEAFVAGALFLRTQILVILVCLDCLAFCCIWSIKPRASNSSPFVNVRGQKKLWRLVPVVIDRSTSSCGKVKGERFRFFFCFRERGRKSDNLSRFCPPCVFSRPCFTNSNFITCQISLQALSVMK